MGAMFQKILPFLKHNRYKLAIFGLMAGASLICIMLVGARITVSDSGRYASLVWNLFLAWIPFLLAYAAYTLSWSRRWLYIVIPITAFLWLIFFPNAPYILTDLQHLAVANWQDIDTWYDVLMLVWFAFTGLLLGMVSLFMMQEIIRREFGRWIGWGFVALVTVLTAVGVYVGRFLRWNSWDILSRPRELADFTLAHAVDPSGRSIVFTTIFAALFLFLYLTLYAFGHLLQERHI